MGRDLWENFEIASVPRAWQISASSYVGMCYNTALCTYIYADMLLSVSVLDALFQDGVK